jgi:manganese transport protein
MKKLAEIFLGILTAVGGFIDIGEMVFASSAGARTGHRLIWVIVLATLGIVVFTEMSGRVATVTKKPVFTVIRERLPFKIGLATWIGSTLINFTTCAAELGGVALLLRYFFHTSPALLGAVTVLTIIAMVALLRFEWIERTFGLAGVVMVVFVVAMFHHGIEWRNAASGLLPTLDVSSQDGFLRSAYFAVGIFASVMMPYEVYFYSSGAIEDKWKPQDLPMNTAITGIGSAFGAVIAIALLLTGAEVMAKQGITPDLGGTATLVPALELGKWGAILAVVGVIGSVSGSAVETGLASGYDFAQFFRFNWGRSKKLKQTPQFDAAWVTTFALGGLLLLTGVDPLDLVECSIIGALLVLPITYFAVLRIAADRSVMGSHVNSRLQNSLGWVFFTLTTIAAAAALPLMIVTDAGKR